MFVLLQEQLSIVQPVCKTGRLPCTHSGLSKHRVEGILIRNHVGPDRVFEAKGYTSASCPICHEVIPYLLATNNNYRICGLDRHNWLRYVISR